LAEIAYVSLAETSLRLVGVVDPLRAGESFLGRQVLAPEALPDLTFDFILVTAMVTPEEFPPELLGVAVADKKVIFIGR